MRGTIWFCLFLLLLSCTQREQKEEQSAGSVPDSANQTPPTTENTVAYDQLEGVWLNTQFEQTLEKTKSPQLATVEVPNVSIYREDGKPVVFVNLQFNEGITVPLNSLKQNGKTLKNGQIEIGIANGDEMTLRLINDPSSTGKAHFRRLNGTKPASLDEEHESVLQYINQVVLTGTYRDEKGKAYQFTPQMKAIFPKASFTYTLALDGTFSGCNGIVSTEAGKGPQHIGYEWQGQRLHLYETKPDPENPDAVVCKKKPFAVLNPMEQQ